MNRSLSGLSQDRRFSLLTAIRQRRFDCNRPLSWTDECGTRCEPHCRWRQCYDDCQWRWDQRANKNGTWRTKSASVPTDPPTPSHPIPSHPTPRNAVNPPTPGEISSGGRSGQFACWRLAGHSVDKTRVGQQQVPTDDLRETCIQQGRQLLEWRQLKTFHKFHDWPLEHWLISSLTDWLIDWGISIFFF